MVACISSQHDSDGQSHGVLRLEIVRDANRQHLHSDDLALAVIATAARCAVHAWIARDEEFRKLMHELAHPIGAALHEVRPVWECVVQFWAARQGEARCAQPVIRDKRSRSFCAEYNNADW